VVGRALAVGDGAQDNRSVGLGKEARRCSIFAVATVAGILALAPPPAVAIERVQDGGFEAAICVMNDCTSPVWQETKTSGSGPGPICSTLICGFPAHSGSQYGIFGPTSVNWTLAQPGIAVPAAPARLTFWLRHQCFGGSGELRALIDTAIVFETGLVPCPNGSEEYVEHTVALNQFVGPGTHTLSFRGLVGTSLIFQVDDISIDAADAPPTCNGKPATIVGTNGNDVRGGTAGKDVIVGLGGSDRLLGLAGNDVLCGGVGKDILNGGKGNDMLFGEAGRDALKGGEGKDKLKGGPGKDKQLQ
jgi:RTX calcium-binding nonapeptide repeat (4 copies)